MVNDEPRRGILLQLAAEGLVPVLGGCAGVLAGGPEAGLAAVAVGQAVEKAINFFGGRIVERWCAWFKGQPPEARATAIADLAALSPEQAREEAGAALKRLAPDARPEDLSLALEYLTAIPRTFDRALVRDPATGACALPPTVSLDEPQLLLQMLPTDVPPYPVPSELPGTPYLLEDLLGSGGFGAVYRATTRSLQHLPLAIKFCLDPSLTAALHRERSNLERLMKVGGAGWSSRIVRLYGYDLEHRTPYLVYEYVAGGDLTHHLDRLRQRQGRELNAEEVLGLMVQVTEGLAFAHRHGLVHRDLKPANVLVDGETLKLADFGLGGVTAARAAQVSRIGATTVDFLTVAERASLFRGAGTPLYMSPEQRRGAPPDPRQDLYSLGVMWFQLLAGDVTRELHPGWAKELAVKHGVPQAHLDLIGRCVGWIEERPRDAGELLPLVQALRGGVPAAIPVAKVAPEVAPPEPPGGLRQSLMVSLVEQLDRGHRETAHLERNRKVPVVGTVALGLPMVLLILGFSGTWASLGVCVPLVGGLAALLFAPYEHRRKEAKKQIEASVKGLTEEFPEAVRQWGGRAVLRSPATVTEIARGLGIEVRAPDVPALQPSPTVGRAPTPPVPVPPEQRGDLLEKLRPLAEAHAEVAACGERRTLPLWGALVLSFLLLGAPAGASTGGLYEEYFSPIHDYSYPGYFDHRGNDITDVEYDLARQRVTATAALLGVVAAVVLTGLGTWVLTWWRTYRRLLVLAVLGSAVALGAPAAAGAYALYQGFFGPVRYYNKGPNPYYDYHGNPLSWVDFTVNQRANVVRGALVAGGTGLALVVVVTAFLVWRRGRLHARARQAVLDQTQEVLTAFPAVVQAWGGAARLHDPAFVRQTLAGLEAGSR
jgi:hypothetical protein